MLPTKFDNLIQEAGSGFASGQIMAAVVNTFKTTVNLGSDMSFADIVSNLKKDSYDYGLNMAQYSVVSTIVSPYVHTRVNNRLLRNIITGAITGSILEWRNGAHGVFNGAITSLQQTFTMEIFRFVVSSVVKPVNQYRHERILSNFHKERDEAIYNDPITVITQAFLPNK